MNQNLSNVLIHHQFILKNTQNVDTSLYTKMKTITIILGEDTKSQKYLVIFSFAKSKILMKNIIDIEKIFLNINKDILCKKNIFFHKAMICSKVQSYLNLKGIKNYAFV
ncbi:Uncharacterised protein [Campylobacter insulaenigrae]|uniref:hypothetical protein n=1 Tax=Campylobacter insulaenigrae TaxID=260714 RepID=UPI000F7169DA|nr:hypothetical protein [Campylobacter insulaenigrae]MCR6591663.1 hypothetical protein [Campylobacter insulaenigrae]MCR6593135.1 hypothetical protein [Campylobacter insulaenigrae]VEJ53170.1 Uncharacterised protein [Campylobacter insulaenigrae]